MTNSWDRQVAERTRCGPNAAGSLLYRDIVGVVRIALPGHRMATQMQLRERRCSTTQ